jgi:hypothetical protein
VKAKQVKSGRKPGRFQRGAIIHPNPAAMSSKGAGVNPHQMSMPPAMTLQHHPATSEVRSVFTHQGRMATVSDNHAAIATADALTLLLYNQHALASAIEELALWVKSTGSPDVHESAITALETLDANASAITNAINRLRQ